MLRPTPKIVPIGSVLVGSDDVTVYTGGGYGPHSRKHIRHYELTKDDDAFCQFSPLLREGEKTDARAGPLRKSATTSFKNPDP